MDTDDLSGKVFVTSGLGGMSGAQAKVWKFKILKFQVQMILNYDIKA